MSYARREYVVSEELLGASGEATALPSGKHVCAELEAFDGSCRADPCISLLLLALWTPPHHVAVSSQCMRCSDVFEALISGLMSVQAGTTVYVATVSFIASFVPVNDALNPQMVIETLNSDTEEYGMLLTRERGRP